MAPLFTKWGSFGRRRSVGPIKGLCWMDEQDRQKMEKEKALEKERKERLSLIEPYKMFCEWPLSVFPTQVITEKSSSLEKDLVLNRLEVHFSLMKKHSCFYWRRPRDSISRAAEGRNWTKRKKGGKWMRFKKRLEKNKDRTKGKKRVRNWENLKKVIKKKIKAMKDL